MDRSHKLYDRQDSKILAVSILFANFDCLKCWLLIFFRLLCSSVPDFELCAGIFFGYRLALGLFENDVGSISLDFSSCIYRPLCGIYDRLHGNIRQTETEKIGLDQEKGKSFLSPELSPTAYIQKIALEWPCFFQKLILRSSSSYQLLFIRKGKMCLDRLSAHVQDTREAKGSCL